MQELLLIICLIIGLAFFFSPYELWLEEDDV